MADADDLILTTEDGWTVFLIRIQLPACVDMTMPSKLWGLPVDVAGAPPIREPAPRNRHERRARATKRRREAAS